MRAWGIALTLVLAARLAAAGPANAPRSRAAVLFEDGRALLQHGDAAGACAKFRASLELDPLAPGTLLNLGLCNEQLGKYKTALDYFRKAQTRASETDEPAAEQAAREHASKLVEQVATVQLAFTPSEPPGVRVTIDGAPVTSDDYRRVELDPGHHELRAIAPGKRAVELPFDVAGTGGQTLQIALVDGTDTVIVDRGVKRRRIGVITAIGGGALMAFAGGYSWYEQGRYCAQFAAGQCGDVAAVGSHRDAANAIHGRVVWAGTGSFVLGAALVAAGGILYVTAPGKERITRTALVPTLAPGGVGLAVRGAF